MALLDWLKSMPSVEPLAAAQLQRRLHEARELHTVTVQQRDMLGRRDGVVHAIAGRVACRCLCHRSCRRKAPPACTSSCRDSPEECGLQTEQKSVRVRRTCSRVKRHVCGSRSRHRTIALFMLAPCSVSSMLFAALRPGRRPGLRALTTPPRGTCQATTRWSSSCRSIKRA